MYSINSEQALHRDKVKVKNDTWPKEPWELPVEDEIPSRGGRIFLLLSLPVVVVVVVISQVSILTTMQWVKIQTILILLNFISNSNKQTQNNTRDSQQYISR